MRNKIVFAAILLITTFSSLAQTGYISDGAFRKMMQDHFRFTVVGSQTPVSGLKVETANPTIALKGNLISNQSRSRILNLELQGGLNEGFMQLFSGKKTSGYFKGSLGINFLFRGNKGYYNRLSVTEKQMTAHAIRNNLKTLTAQMDSFAIIQVLTDNPNFHNSTTFTLQNFVDEVYNLSIQNSNQLDSLQRTSLRTIPQWRQYFETLILAMLAKYGADTTITGDARLNDFRTKISDTNNTTIKTANLLQDYDRLHDILIKEATKFNWNLMRIGWVNISVYGGNNRFWLYNSAKQLVVDTNSFTRGVSGSYNLFFKYKQPHRYIFLRTGVMLQRVNNLADLSKFSYKQETVITATPGTLTDKKEGTAYQGELPGVYAKPVLRHSKAWINHTQLAADIGIVWNVNSSDKDAKNILTIVPYVSWSNLLPAYKDATKTEKQAVSDRFSFNVKFGVPFNLGK
jgi:hypothetical protein